MAHERICIICNKNYKYCPKCREYNSDEKWRFIYCSENCKDIHNILDEYECGTIDGYEAKIKLKSYDYNLNNSTKYSLPLFEKINNSRKKSVKKNCE